MAQDPASVANLGFLSGDSEMAARIRGHDWAATPLGDPAQWPQSLRSALGICLNSSFPTAIYWGADLRLLYNDAWAPIPADRHPACLGQPAEAVWDDIWAVIAPQFRRVIETGQGFSTFDQMLPMVRDGVPRETYWNYSFTPIRGEDGGVVGVFNQGHETTDRVLRDRDRDADAARQQRLFAQAPGFITILKGPDHVFEFVNDAYRRLFGDRDYVGRPVRAVFPELAGQGFYEWLDGVYRTGERFVADRVPATLDLPDGTTGTRLLDFIYAPVVDDDGQVTGIFCEGFDVTAAQESERLLHDKSRALETLNRIAVATIVETDLEPIVQAVTDAGIELTGAAFAAFFYNVIASQGESYMLYSLSGAPRGAFDHFPMPRNTELFAPTFGGEGVVRSDDVTRDPRYGRNLPNAGMPEGHLAVRSYLAVPVISRGGEVIGGLLFGHPETGRFTAQHEDLVAGLASQAAIAIDNARLIQRVRDANETLEQRVAARTAELTEAHEALRQAQKMEAVGQLTGGIAHDFNNLLTIVIGSVDIARRALAAGDAARSARAMDNAQKGAERAAALTQRLLAFSRRQPLDPKPLNVDRLVAGMSDLLNRALGETIALEVVTSPGLWRIEADPNQLESAILNLAVNARDAMPAGGRLTIETANARLDDSYTAQHAEVAPGNYVVITVTDTGAGMNPETLSRVFEPFFTTKEVGRGTGLGLSQVYGFVKQSGGHVKIYSELGEGTSVRLYLPRLMGQAAADDAATHAAPSHAFGARDETILVVEDDGDVRAYTVEILRELGYRVIEAEGGETALRLLGESAAPIDLLFTDVVMPGMSGRDVVEAARAIQPHLKVLYTSGYTRNAIVHGGRLDPGVDLIAKPFTYEELARRIREILEAGTTGRILIAAGAHGDRGTLRAMLAQQGYAVDEAANAVEALGRVRSARGLYGAVLIDDRLPDKRGSALLGELRALQARLPLLLLAESAEVAELRERFGADHCVAILPRLADGATVVATLSRLGAACAAAP